MPRALTASEIKKKETFIMKKALKLFEENTFKSFRMDDLAKLSNMSKGILFKYFKTKEMLFIRMLEKEYERAIYDLDDLLKHHNEMTKEEYKELMVEQFREVLNPKTPLLRLIALKSSVLEVNQDYDFAIKNKTRINDLLYELSQNVLLKVNGLSFTHIQEMLDVQSIIISGYLNNYVKEGIVKNVIEDANLDMFMGDYKEISVNLFKTYLKDL